MTDRRATGIASLAALAGIVLVGLALRLRGITFGLPAVYNPDELAIMSRALAFAKGDLNPHNFLYPTLYFYVLFAWIAGYFVLGRITGAVRSAAAFEQQFFIDPSGIYLAGRILGVVCGVLTIVALYIFARRLHGRSVGLSAAALLAVAPYAVRDAHYVKHDVPVTLLIVMAATAIVTIAPKIRPFDSGRTRTVCGGSVPVAAVLCGLAASTHYYAVFLALPLSWALWMRCHGNPTVFVRSMLRAGVFAAGAFFIASPFLLAEPATAIRDIVANRQIVVDRAVVGSGGFFASGAAYVRMLWQEATGWPVFALAIAGAVLQTASSWRTAVLILAFPVAFLLFISNTVPAGRYLNPVLPYLAMLAALALSSTARALGPRAAPVAAVALTMVAASPGFMTSMRIGSFFRQTDTRTLALEYIERTIPPDSTIAVQPYSTPLRPSQASLREGLTAHGLTDPAMVPTRFARQLALDPYPAPAYRLVYLGDGGLDQEKIYVGYRELGGARGLSALRERHVQYIVVKRYNVPDRDTLPFFDALASEGIRLAVFSPFRPDVADRERESVEPFLHNTDTPLSAALARPGPVIEIWKL